MIKGITVQYIVQTQIGTDPFGAPIYSETAEDVNDVLVGQPTTDDVTTTVSLYGKRVELVLGIPRTDTHEWADAVVQIRGERYRTIGYPMRGVDENVPLRWNRNVKVERYG